MGIIRSASAQDMLRKLQRWKICDVGWQAKSKSPQQSSWKNRRSNGSQYSRLEHALPNLGQFLDHDIILTTSGTESVPIPIPLCDPSFDTACTGTQSLPFRRTTFDPSSVVRTQLNRITAWVDASQIYGSNKVTADSLRSFSQGKLKTSSDNLLPKTPTGSFLAGDTRVN